MLFRNYLRGDPTTIEWAQQIVSEALGDVEQAALAAHRRALDAAGGRLHVVPADLTVDGLADIGLDPATATDAVAGHWTPPGRRCTDHDEHPATGRPCRASFLDCFHCGNCLITSEHLPRLLGLLDALSARRQHLSEQDWWSRYGPAWAAIRLDVLAKFSPAEIEQAAAAKPADVPARPRRRPPWEHP